MNNPLTRRSQIMTAFNDTKVETCREVVNKNGRIVAVPFRNLSASPPRLKVSNTRSVAHEVHRVHTLVHAGMLRKPLEPYSPAAARSRLMSQEYIPIYSNTSSIMIGDRQLKDNKQFLSMARSMLKRPEVMITTNPGIISEKTRWLKHKYLI